MIDSAHWQQILTDHWGITAHVQPLPGEYDLNVRVVGADGRDHVLKIMRPGCDPAFVALCCDVHRHLAQHAPLLPLARVVPTTSGAMVATVHDPAGESRLAWLLTALPGVAYALVRPHPPSLLGELGETVARLHGALADFRHPLLTRALKWDLTRAEWIADALDAIDDPVRRLRLAEIVARYRAVLDVVRAQPVQAIHNDLNDWNLLVARDADGVPRLTGLIDFGDVLEGPVVAELAIAGAYLVLDHPHPERALAAFVAGYNRVSPLTATQCDLLWPLLLMRLAVSVTNAAMVRQERPDDPYVSISEGPAWRFLARAATTADAQMRARLRLACGLPPTDGAERVRQWLTSHRTHFAPVMGGVDLARLPTGSLAMRSALVPRDPMRMTHDEAATLGAAAGVGSAWIGSYGEPRAVYTASAFRLGAHPTADRRTVHLGVDVFLPAGTPVHAPCAGVVEVADIRDASLDYGGVVVLRHTTPDGDPFWTLYGHLAHADVEQLHVGQSLAHGARIASLGTPEENGGWDPHLHLQMALVTEGMEHDWPGVADPDDRALWLALCPNPAALLGLDDARVAYAPLDMSALRDERRAHFASNLRLSYREPLCIVRGWRHYLFDEWARPYLDAYNNVPHVGHAHPRLAAVAAEQLARLNTNTRYLHPVHVAFARELLSWFPAEFTHVFFVNSGSEANELALRLARTHTGGRDMITPDHGYHGNTTGAYDLSAYKFNKPRGGGRPEWVHLVPVADAYRGPYRDADAGARYAAHVDDAIAAVHARGARLAGFIAETFPSVGGQIIPPPGYLRGVHDRVRAAGGVCIADEVQTGLGRLGAVTWGFAQQEAMPDIVVLGKPLGNGHPLGAVVTTRAIAESFDNGIEFFSTFGGSTLSCRIGLEVLRIVREERLQENAAHVGARLLDGLRALQTRHTAIGDVRGMGLFIGVDLVTDRTSRDPATALARYVVNRLREERVLVGTEGPADNVLKIRPPLTIGAADVDWLVSVLDGVLGEWE
ncbi:MAG: aminotransferase class III-fold pyridoxal phosphate-dependent enzyme [Gemmatimonadaceae bacterium]|jgi:4-aminobutyrate aminotransferase-like enzyme/Ser/Thr protein kinase RdoA (MazF antagonist)|nr:aminotransferase class III-fold pyridoxal phosphate-dependent enzyme [Gemmatimonadaceae bacterium]